MTCTWLPIIFVKRMLTNNKISKVSKKLLDTFPIITYNFLIGNNWECNV